MSKLGLSLLLATALTAALAASAPAAIKIAKIRYNPPGADTGSNASLNGEWITIKNTGSAARQLNGWRVRDKSGHVYRFGSLSLPGGATVKLHTGSGSDSFPHHLYWGRSQYVWNNNKDKATLRNANGKVVDTCSYTSKASGAKTC